MGRVIKVEGNVIYVDFQNASQANIENYFNIQSLALVEE